MPANISKEVAIRQIVKTAVISFSDGFQGRHEGERDDPEGTINMKIHNVFIAALGEEMQFYSALIRSLDSSLGNMLETLAINIAELFFVVKHNVEGPLSSEQTSFIAELLEKYKRHEIPVKTIDYEHLRQMSTSTAPTKRHDSDYYLIDSTTGQHYLIELKIGGDLDNKKARSEKEAILEQYAILSNTLNRSVPIKIYFATAYNRFGEGKAWNQERVKQFFSTDELLIGKDFWDFICQDSNGYNYVLDEYKKNARYILKTLETIKKAYLS